MNPYLELVDFIAETAGQERLARFHPSEAAQARVNALVEKQKEGGLPDSEQEELEMFLQLEHVMRLAKARAGAPPLSACAA